jgi:hypothetical protein
LAPLKKRSMAFLRVTFNINIMPEEALERHVFSPRAFCARGCGFPTAAVFIFWFWTCHQRLGLSAARPRYTLRSVKSAGGRPRNLGFCLLRTADSLLAPVFGCGRQAALRCVAIDGWEPVASYDRRCPHCLTRQVKVKRGRGEAEEVTQYYHRYVVAMLLGPIIDVVLAMEPVLNEEARRDHPREHIGHEGELTAARRLIDSLHQTSGGFIDALVMDALYANGPLMAQLDSYGYGGFICPRRQPGVPL